MLKRKLDTDYITVSRPSTIEVDGGVKIHIDNQNNVIIEGQNSLKFKCDGDMDFDAENINLHASKDMIMNIKGEVYLGSNKHIIQQAPRIDLNPMEESTGYYGNIKSNVLKMFDFIRMKNRQMRCEEVDEG